MHKTFMTNYWNIFVFIISPPKSPIFIKKNKKIGNPTTIMENINCFM